MCRAIGIATAVARAVATAAVAMILPVPLTVADATLPATSWAELRLVLVMTLVSRSSSQAIHGGRPDCPSTVTVARGAGRPRSTRGRPVGVVIGVRRT